MLIEEYFQIVEAAAADCPYIIESEIRKDKRSLHIGIIEGKIRFTDNSILYFLEFVSVKIAAEKYRYSYHYQDRAGSLIFRYDMAPHHKEVKTFPHHKHLSSEKVIESTTPALREVLLEIEGHLINGQG